MKRGMMLGLPVALAGVLTGFWLGSPAATENGAAPDPKAKPERVARRHHDEPAASKGSGQTYAALARELVHAKGLPLAAFRGIESATDRELQDLLLEVAMKELPGHPYRPGSEKQRAALNAAAAELFRREGVKSLEWAAEVENFDLFLALMTAAAGQDPALMKEWLVKFGSDWNSTLIATAEREAALRSADDLLAVETLFSGSLESDFRGFAESFDFSAYLKATQSPYAGEKVYGFWTARDPEAATEGVREVLAAAHEVGIGGIAVSAMDGRANMSSEAEAAEWMGGVLADLTGRTRELAVRGLAEHPQALALMSHLPSDQDRVTFAATHLRANYDSVEAAMPVLEALPSQAVQVEAVGRWVREMRDAEAKVLDDVMERLAFPEDQREVLRARLSPPY